MSELIVELGKRVLELTTQLERVERDLDSRVDRGSVRLDNLEELDHEATAARVDVNRRLDLIETDVIDRAEETHKRITNIVNDLATLALRCGMTDDSGKEGGS